MKNFVSTLVCLISFSTLLSADMIRVEAGAGIWLQSPSGTLEIDHPLSSDVVETSSKDTENKPYVWALIKHPAPLIPNLRVEYTGVDSTNLSGNTAMVEMAQFDIIPYYNILDNTFWITLDLGIDLKVMQTDYNSDLADADSYTTALPLLYVRTRVEIPTTDIGLEADVKYVSYDSETVYDARIKLDYTLDFFPLVQPAIEIGYRVQKIETEKEGVNLDMEFSGPYAGLMVRF